MDQRTSFIRRKSVLTTKGAVYVCVSLPSPATSPLTIAMPTNLDHSYTPTDKGTNQPVAQEQENSDMPIKDIRSYLTKGPESSSSTPPLPIKPTHPLPQRQPKLTLLRRLRNYTLSCSHLPATPHAPDPMPRSPLSRRRASFLRLHRTSEAQNPRLGVLEHLEACRAGIPVIARPLSAVRCCCD